MRGNLNFARDNTERLRHLKRERRQRNVNRMEHRAVNNKF